MALVLVSPPESEPISLDGVKAHLKQDLDDDDALIAALLVSARLHVETELWRQLITARWRLTLDRFPPGGGEIRIPWCPVRAIEQVRYVDQDGLQLLDPSHYQVDLDSEPARIRPAPGLIWPETDAEQLAAVAIEFTAGYGAAEDVPAGIKQYVLSRAAFFYEHRGDDQAVWPDYLERTLDPYRWRVL
jgi:uncharacterized phiE125 gp8 family phage protein